MSLSAIELGRSIKEKKIGVAEAAVEALAAIEEKDKAIGSFVTVDRAGVCKRAEEVQRQINAGELISPLAGVPFAVKDNLCTQGLRTTCGSNMLSDFKPAYTAEAVRNLERAGAVLPAVRARRWRRRNAATRLVRIPVVRSVSQAPFAG